MTNTNQTAKADAGKPQLSLVPPEIIKDIAYIRMYGTKKYGSPDNWKQVEIERYRDAAYRHWLAYLADPAGVDEESGYPHIWHVACNIAFLCELEAKRRMAQQIEEAMPEPVPEPETKLKKPKQKVDVGRIVALHKAGRSPAWIADDVKCSVGTVYRVLKDED